MRARQVLLLIMAFWVVRADAVVIPADVLAVRRIDDLPLPGMDLDVGWRYRVGHSEAWAARDFDDSGWALLEPGATELTPATREAVGWKGEGWFRLHVAIDPQLAAEQVVLVFGHKGAAAIYLDGVPIYTSGQFPGPRIAEQPHFVIAARHAVPLAFVPGSEHVIAVHYSNVSYLNLLRAPDDSGFVAALTDSVAWDQLLQHFIHSRAVRQTLAILPLAFGLLHLLLFAYQLQRPAHLYFATFALSVAMLIFAPLHLGMVHTPLPVTLLLLAFKWSLLASPITGLLFLYHEFLGGTSKLFRWECVAAGLTAAFCIFLPLETVYYVSLLLFADVVRVVIIGLRRGTPDAAVVRAGWFLFAVGCVWQVFLELDIVEPPFGADTIDFVPYVGGILILVMSMSVYLARAVSRTNQDLAVQLEHVRELSERAVEHEREVQSAKLATLNQLMAGVVHELNTPLGAIRSAHDTLRRAVDRIRSSVPDGAPLRAIDSSTEILDNATDRVSTVLAGFKSFSHLDEAEWQIAQVETGLDETLAMMDAQLHQVQVERDYAGVPAIWCAPARLNQVFMHLLSNALAAMEEDSTQEGVRRKQISLRTWATGEDLFVSVKDAGCGMAAEQLEGLFDVGFRRHSRIKMGLGLVADVSTVHEHGGQLSVESERNVGTVVTLQLPLRRSDQ